MKISEQARKAGEALFYHDDQKCYASEAIQIAINDHERDLVEAAEMIGNSRTREDLEQAAKALFAALDRRKE